VGGDGDEGGGGLEGGGGVGGGVAGVEDEVVFYV
jgi:hypothetical protein